ncbi:MAG: PQQ-dependent sugar dehydrogenase [Actinomycetota bacterium]|nr:PQQ-dependent sugar dehydrogenase [Actinomycetota bacterium]
MRTIRSDQPAPRRTVLRRVTATAVGAVALAAVACAPTTPTDPPTTAPPTSAPPTTAPADGPLRVVEQIPGFDRPWELRFTPGGVPLVTEKAGRVVTVGQGQRRIVGDVPGVVANGEGGLMGLAVDPGYASNRRVYVCHTSASDVRVVRFTVGSGESSLTEATPVLTGIPSGSGNRHQGCRLAFGSAGELWVTTGDATIPTAPAARGNLAGKVLRMTAAGAPWPGNPAETEPGAGWHPLVYTRGHRNVQGIAVRRSDGAVFTVEHGTGCDDEVNRLVAGADYGWDPVGPTGGYDESKPMTKAGATGAVWSSGCPTVAPSGAAFLDGSQWGRRNGLLAVAMLKQQRLTLMDVSNSSAGGGGVVEHHFDPSRRLRSVVQGPDGSLWIVADGSGAPLLRVTD